MRTFACVVVVAGSLLGCACTPRGDGADAAIAPAVQTPPPGARAKIGADQAAATSPVPAFRALGDGWRLQAEGIEGVRLSARLQRDGSGEQNATLVYDPHRAGMTPRTHAMAGTVYGKPGSADQPIDVTLVRMRCDNAEGEHAWRAEVRVGGGAVLRGCADVAT